MARQWPGGYLWSHITTTHNTLELTFHPTHPTIQHQYYNTPCQLASSPSIATWPFGYTSLMPIKYNPTHAYYIDESFTPMVEHVLGPPLHIPLCNLCNTNTNDKWLPILSTCPNHHLATISKSHHAMCWYTLTHEGHSPNFPLDNNVVSWLPSMHLLCSPLLMLCPTMSKCRTCSRNPPLHIIPPFQPTPTSGI